MRINRLKAINNSTRNTSLLEKKELIRNSKIFKTLKFFLNKKFGRGKSSGKITSWHKQRGAKALYRDINKSANIYKSVLVGISYNPNVNSFTSVLFDLERKKFFNKLHIEGTYPGTLLEKTERIKRLHLGDKLTIESIPIGTLISNLCINSQMNTKYIKAAGTVGQIINKVSNHVTVKLPSNKTIQVPTNCTATIGAVSNDVFKTIILGKAGRNRNSGRRPVVRGIAMNPVDHPHGGRTNGGRPSVTPWGLPTKGKFKLKKRKYV